MDAIGEIFRWAVQQDEASRKSNRRDGMLLDWLLTQVSQAEDKNEVFWSDNQWFFWKEKVKNGLVKSLGLDPMPHRTPLNVRHVGVVERERYRIEKLILEPRPFFMVPAHLYVPLDSTLPAPAILYSVGHWMKYSKMEPDIQTCCIGLARLGFVVLVYDPLGQGERGCSFYEHGHRDLLLVGLSQAGLMVWESIRMIDYLLSRPEVDGHRIGMTGASGGGLNTLYTAAVDERIAVAVPVCYVTSFSAFLRAMCGTNWNGGVDLCNQVPHVLQYSDMAALCALIAPRPLMIIGGIRDPQFPIEGARRTFQRVQKVYSLFGVVERTSLVEIDSGHGYHQPMREHAYSWFSRWLLERQEEVRVAENGIATEDPESAAFRCLPWDTPIPSGPIIVRLVKEKAQQWRHDQMLKFSDKDIWLQYRQDLGKRVQQTLGLQLPLSTPRVTREGEFERGTFTVTRMLMCPDKGIVVPFYHWKQKGYASRKWIIYLQENGKSDETVLSLLEAGLPGGFDIFTVDLRGFGETSPVAPEFLTLATIDGTLEVVRSQPGDTLEFEVATDSLMLGKPLVGQQVQDLLYFIEYLKMIAIQEGIAEPVWIGLFASGLQAALVGLFVGAVEESVQSVILDQLLLSYASLAGHGTLAPMGIYIFDVLSHFDLPQVAALVAPRRLIIGHCVTFVGAEKHSVETDRVRQTYFFAKSVYDLFHSQENFRIEQQPFLQLYTNEISIIRR